MRQLPGIGLRDVQSVYSGPEGRLWELLMGEQIHIGGLRSSNDLADRADIRPGMAGVDLCCASGAGMRFLVRLRGVGRMIGVDATPHMVELGRRRTAEAGLGDRIEFVLGEATQTGLPDGSMDFVWGEDAWCYVVEKERLIAEAVRLVRPGGTIAFTDWVEGSVPMTGDEAARFLRFMKFANLLDIPGYVRLLESAGCSVEVAEDSGRFPGCADLYIQMLEAQLAYDALRILGFDSAALEGLTGELAFVRGLAHARKIVQGVFVARVRAGRVRP